MRLSIVCILIERLILWDSSCDSFNPSLCLSLSFQMRHRCWRNSSSLIKLGRALIRCNTINLCGFCVNTCATLGESQKKWIEIKFSAFRLRFSDYVKIRSMNFWLFVVVWMIVINISSFSPIYSLRPLIRFSLHSTHEPFCEFVLYARRDFSLSRFFFFSPKSRVNLLSFVMRLHSLIFHINEVL